MNIPRHIIDSLVAMHALDGSEDVRLIDDPDYGEGAIECYGKMPNSNETGWFFAGYLSEISDGRG